jgi:hypothetical protein
MFNRTEDKTSRDVLGGILAREVELATRSARLTLRTSKTDNWDTRLTIEGPVSLSPESLDSLIEALKDIREAVNQGLTRS